MPSSCSRSASPAAGQAEAAPQAHEPLRAPRLDRLEDELRAEAGAAALPQPVEVPALRPPVGADLDPEPLARGLAAVAVPIPGGLGLPGARGRQVVVVRGEDAARAQQPCGLREGRLRLHPVQRLRAGDEVGAAAGQAGLVREPWTKRRSARSSPRSASSCIAGFGSTPTTSSASPAHARVESPVPQPRSNTSRALDACDLEQRLDERPRRPRPEAVVVDARSRAARSPSARSACARSPSRGREP